MVRLLIPKTTSLIKTSIVGNLTKKDTVTRAAPIWSLIFSYWPQKQAKHLTMELKYFIILILSFQGIIFDNACTNQRQYEDLHWNIDRPLSQQAAFSYQVNLVQYVSIVELRIIN